MQNTIITSILLFFLFGIIHKASGQTRAVTADGDTIYVYKNGTWSFEPNDVAPKVNDLDFLSTELKIDTVLTSFQPPPSANKELENAYPLFLTNILIIIL